MFAQFRGKCVKREHAIAFALLFNVFSWYFMGNSIVNEIGNNGLTPKVAYPSSIIISGLLGSALLTRFDRKRILLIWTIAGVAASLCLTIPKDFSPLVEPIVTILVGSSLGVGMPLLLSYFTGSMAVDNRGRIAGLVFFATALTAPLFTVILPKLNMMLAVTVFAVWRLWSLPLLLPSFNSVGELGINKPENASYMRVVQNRTMILYFTAWLMFNLVDGFGSIMTQAHIEELSVLIRLYEPIVASLSALIGGIVSDRVGRKRIIMFGFVLLGIGYAAIGLVPQMEFSWLFYLVVDGIAAGSLLMLFTIVLWGEIALRGTEKCYAIGEVPYFLAGIVSLGLAGYIAMIPETSAFSLAAFFLFVAVVPLMYAAETLPEKKMKERELKIYIEKAQKVKQKYA